jgi:hypothetical protein
MRTSASDVAWKILSLAFGWHWLGAFDADDLREFAGELSAALVAALRGHDSRLIGDVLHRWRVTAQCLGDPVRRAILYGPVKPEDFIEVARPEARRPQER